MSRFFAGRILLSPERGCVEDQPQQLEQIGAGIHRRRYVLFRATAGLSDTAALRINSPPGAVFHALLRGRTFRSAKSSTTPIVGVLARIGDAISLASESRDWQHPSRMKLKSLWLSLLAGLLVAGCSSPRLPSSGTTLILKLSELSSKSNSHDALKLARLCHGCVSLHRSA